MPKPALYYLPWHYQYLTNHARTIEDMIQAYEEGLREVKEMAAAGITLEFGEDEDEPFFITDDTELAERFGFYPLESDDEYDEEDCSCPEEDEDEEGHD